MLCSSIVALSLFVGVGALPRLCPSDWSYFNATCWRYAATKSFPTRDAAETCGDGEAWAASLHSEEELRFAVSLMPPGGTAWLGGAERWPRWTDGSPWHHRSGLTQNPSLLELNNVASCWVLTSEDGGRVADIAGLPGGYAKVFCQAPTVNGSCAEGKGGFGRCFFQRAASVSVCREETLDDLCRTVHPNSTAAVARSLEEVKWLRSTFAAFAVGAVTRTERPEVDLLRWLDGSPLDFRPAFDPGQSAARSRGANFVALRQSSGQLQGRSTFQAAGLPFICRRKVPHRVRESEWIAGDSAYYARGSDDSELSAALQCAESCIEAYPVEKNGTCGIHCAVMDPPSEAGLLSKEVPPSLVERPRSCSEIKRQNPAAASGVYRLKLPSEPTYDCPKGSVHCDVEVFCDMETEGGGWTVVQRQEKGDEDFDRGMHEYELGFGERLGDHWLGLWRLQALAAYRRTDLLVSVLFRNASCRRRALYRNFRVLNYDGYTYDYDAFDAESTLPDALAGGRTSAKFFVAQDPKRKSESCDGWPGYLPKADICSVWDSAGMSGGDAQLGPRCARLHPLLRPSRFSEEEAAHFVQRWGHYGAAVIKVSSEAGEGSGLPANWTRDASAGSCLAAYPRSKSLVATCATMSSLCSYPFNKADSGGWWWEGTEKAWVHPNGVLRPGCGDWTTAEGLPAAWAPPQGDAVEGLAGVTIALRDADFPSVLCLWATLNSL